MKENLPIGSVVSLISHEKALIVGLQAPNVYWAVPYPEGYVPDTIISFSADNIYDVLAYGYRDLEYLLHKRRPH